MGVLYKFFSVRAVGGDAQEAEQNSFLSRVMVINVKKELIDAGENSFWAVAVEYLSNSSTRTGAGAKKKRIDYREVLPPEEFSVFALLREWRKKAALAKAPVVPTQRNGLIFLIIK